RAGKIGNVSDRRERSLMNDKFIIAPDRLTNYIGKRTQSQEQRSFVPLSPQASQAEQRSQERTDALKYIIDCNESGMPHWLQEKQPPEDAIEANEHDCRQYEHLAQRKQLTHASPCLSSRTVPLCCFRLICKATVL